MGSGSTVAPQPALAVARGERGATVRSLGGMFETDDEGLSGSKGGEIL